MKKIQRRIRTDKFTFLFSLEITDSKCVCQVFLQEHTLELDGLEFEVASNRVRYENIKESPHYDSETHSFREVREYQISQAQKTAEYSFLLWKVLEPGEELFWEGRGRFKVGD